VQNPGIIKERLYIGNGNDEEAIKCYDKSLKLDPNNLLAWNDKGNIYYDQKNYDKAIKCYDKAIEIDKTYFLSLE